MCQEITASNLLKVDLATGELIDRLHASDEYNVAAHLLHGSVLAARPDLICFAHVHTPAIMAVAAMSCGLLPITQTAMGFYGRVGYHDYGVDDDGSRRLADDIAAHEVVIMRNHGVMIGARSIPEAFVELHNLEFACRAQVQAMAAAPLLQQPSDEVLAAHVANLDQWFNRRGGPRDPAGCVEWEACLRLLAREGHDYAV